MLKQIALTAGVVLTWSLFIVALGFYPTATGLTIGFTVMISCSYMGVKVMLEDWRTLGNEGR